MSIPRPSQGLHTTFLLVGTPSLETCYGRGTIWPRIRPSDVLRYEVLGLKGARGYVFTELRSVYVPSLRWIVEYWARSLRTYISSVSITTRVPELNGVSRYYSD